MKHWQRVALIFVGVGALLIVLRERPAFIMGIGIAIAAFGAVSALVLGSRIVRPGSWAGYSPWGALLAYGAAGFKIIAVMHVEDRGVLAVLIWLAVAMFASGLALERRARRAHDVQVATGPG